MKHLMIFIKTYPKVPVSYKQGFWALAGILILGAISLAAVLQVYDKTPLDVLYRLDFVTDPNLADHHAWLPEYYTADIEIAPYSYSRNVKTLDDFYEWRDEPGGVLAGYQDRPSIHDIPKYTAELVESKATAGYTLNKFIMPAFFDPETIIFYELLPDTGAETYNAVLLIPGSGHQGALDVLGEPGPWAGYYYHDGIAKRLVDEGYAVYVVELRGYGERAIDVGMACNTKGNPTTCSSVAVENKLLTFGIEMNDLRIDEITQILAHAESKPYIDRIAVAGLSLGAGLATSQAIINGDVVDAAVMASGIGTVLYSPLNMEAGASYYQASCCDTLDQTATIASMPMYVSYGKQESAGFRWNAESGFTNEFLGGVYELHGKPDNFYYFVHDGGHEYHVPSVLDFLDRHVGIVPESG